MKRDQLEATFGKKLVQTYEDNIGKTAPLTVDQRKAVLAELVKATQKPEFWNNPCMDVSVDGREMKVLLLRAVKGTQEKGREFSGGINLNLLFSGTNGDDWIGAMFPPGAEKAVVDDESYFICGKYSEKKGQKGTFRNLAVTAMFDDADFKPATGLKGFA